MRWREISRLIHEHDCHFHSSRYPSFGCSSAEPNSVSPDITIVPSCEHLSTISPFAFYLVRRSILQCLMQSLRVIKHLDVLDDRKFCFFARLVHTIRINPLGLEFAKPTFARRIPANRTVRGKFFCRQCRRRRTCRTACIAAVCLIILA